MFLGIQLDKSTCGERKLANFDFPTNSSGCSSLKSV